MNAETLIEWSLTWFNGSEVHVWSLAQF